MRPQKTGGAGLGTVSASTRMSGTVSKSPGDLHLKDTPLGGCAPGRFGLSTVVGRRGSLQHRRLPDIGINVNSGHAALNLYWRLSEVVKRNTRDEPFAVYGTLLGLLRGDGVGSGNAVKLGHLSSLRHGPSATVPLRDLGLALIDEGLEVSAKVDALEVLDPDTGARAELFLFYFDEQGILVAPFRIARTTEVKQSSWQGFRDVTVDGQSLPVPANAEEIVDGVRWQTVEDDFAWEREWVRRSTTGLLSADAVEEIYWANFLAHNEFSAGSTFSEVVSAWPDLPSTVIDIGCGDGRDSWAFARDGRQAIGVDRSVVGMRHARVKAEASGLASRLTFVAEDVSDASRLRETLAAGREIAAGEPLGDMLAAEFRSDKDAASTKVYGKHYRRFQNGPAFGRSLRERFGLEVVDEREGIGFSPYLDEDPYLNRAIARRGPPPVEGRRCKPRTAVKSAATRSPCAFRELSDGWKFRATTRTRARAICAIEFRSGPNPGRSEEDPGNAQGP
jgi:hypothetical protein